MQKLFTLITMLLLPFIGFSLPSESNPCDSTVVILKAQQKINKIDIDLLKKDLDTIKINTEPKSVFKEYVENKVLDNLYEILFGGGDKQGAIPFTISIISFLLGLIKLIWSIIKLKKVKGERVEKDGNLYKILSIIISLLLLTSSFLLFILSNKNYQSTQVIQLDKLETEIALIHKEVVKSGQNTPPHQDTIYINKEVHTKLNKIDIKLNEVKNLIKASEKATAEKIENKGCNGWLIFINLVLTGVVVFILVKDRF